MKIGTGDKTTTNWPGTPTQPPSQADQIISAATDPGRVYYVATDELGNFYVGDYFKVDQATGTATLNSSAFNLSGLESLQLGAIGGLIGASINEFSTDGTMSQNSDAKCPTQAAVRTYVGSVNALAPSGGTLVITGGLTVSGTTTTVSTANTTIEDQLVEFNNGQSGAPSGDIGHIYERGDQNNIFIGWDESEDKFRLATTTATGASTGDLAFVAVQTLLANVEGTLTGNASTASNLTGTPNISVGTVGCGTVTSTGDLVDSKGDVRRIPQNAKTSGYTLQGSDSGKHISITTGGIGVPQGIFVAGQAISVYNNSGSDQLISQAGGVTLRLVGKSDTGDRTLAERGLCTILCVASNEFVVTGGGLT